MKIIKKSYTWKGRLSLRSKTEYVVLHHAAATKCSADDIHRIHLGNGWTGIGYHFYVRKDGSVYEGRPIDTLGAHVEGHNSECIGVCFEGNFEKENMTDVQINAGKEIVSYIKSVYPSVMVKKHSEFNATVCPGKKFPFDTISKGITEFTNSDDIVAELSKRGIMTNLPLWKAKCKTESNSLSLAKMICNKTKMVEERKVKLESINDIVWELWYRKLIEDRALWIELMEKDKNLYWLGYKAVNLTGGR